ncbi:MAG TPA: hypothetical protein VFN35_36055 [Ktedonobacteraceae bacterium]|nr:hypothetical protein [Ktedonobacteraceae bacterium]
MNTRSRSERLYALLLKCFPQAYQQDFGEPMLCAFRDMLEHQPAWVVWSIALKELPGNLIQEYLSAFKGHLAMKREALSEGILSDLFFIEEWKTLLVVGIIGALLGAALGLGIGQSVMGLVVGTVIGASFVPLSIGLIALVRLNFGIKTFLMFEGGTFLALFSELNTASSGCLGFLSFMGVILFGGFVIWHSLDLAILAGIGVLIALPLGLPLVAHFKRKTLDEQ